MKKLIIILALVVGSILSTNAKGYRYQSGNNSFCAPQPIYYVPHNSCQIYQVPWQFNRLNHCPTWGGQYYVYYGNQWIPHTHWRFWGFGWRLPRWFF